MWKASSLLIAAVLILTTLGFVMLASTSGAQAESALGDSYYFVKRQAVWLVFALVAGLLTARVIDYHYLQKHIGAIAVLTLALVVAVHIPGLGITVKGSTRWINLGFANLQTSELAKIGAIAWIAWWMSREQRWAGTFTKGFLFPFIFPGLVCLLILVQPDFGSALLIAIVALMMVYLAGGQVGYLLVSFAVGMAGFIFLVMNDDVRRRRVFAFLNPHDYASHEAFQLLQAKYAFVSGGIFGVGLGNSVQKRDYLPEAHTDFIFAIIGEELGVIATVGVLLLYLVIFMTGIRISLRAKDMFGKLLGLGITLIFTLQACMNIAVVTGCLPTKGITLPLISFGGSSLVVSYIMMGILLNIASQVEDENDQDNGSYIKDSTHWI